MIDTRVKGYQGDYLAYTLTKKMLYEFTKMSALDLAPNIRVNAIAPGFILEPLGSQKAKIKKLTRSIPMKTKGNIDEILYGLDYLLQNEYVTGDCLFIDGGRHMRQGDE